MSYFIFLWRKASAAEDRQVKCKIKQISASIRDLEFQLLFTKLLSISCIFRSLFLMLVPSCYYYTKRRKSNWLRDKRKVNRRERTCSLYLYIEWQSNS